MAGIAFLRRLLMKQAMKKSAGSSGIMSLNKNLVNDVDTTVKKWIESAKKQGQDIDKMGEQEIKYIVELNKPKAAPHTLEELVEKLGLNDPKKNKFLQKEGEVVDMTGKTIKNTENIMGGEEVIIDVVGDTVTNMKAMTPMDAMKEANLVIGRKGKYKNLTIDESQDILKKTNDHIFERDIPIDPEDFAQGGRTGSGLNYLLGEDDQNTRVPFGEGGTTQEDFNQFLKEREQRDKDEEKRKFKKDYEDWKKWQKTQGGTVDFAAEGGRMGFGLGGMGRRAFLKLMGSAAAGTAAAGTGLLGLLKGGGKKAAIKELTTVPIKAGADGMPLWFKPLVNKVIKEGEDVTKKFSTMDREIVHAAELPGSKTKVLVSQDITTGNVAVDIGYGKHGFSEGHLGQPVRLFYKAEEIIEPSITKNKEVINKAGKTEPEFWVDEAEFTGGHPENIKFEETISEKFGSHGSDFTEVEKFATGKVKKVKPSIKAERSHWTPEGDMASGGRVPLSGGGIAGMLGE